jgi:type VI secretion system protein ImpM
MTVGVFGKLPARRDYVQHRVEARLMELLDPWLQGAVSESRKALGDDWLDIYLKAPIWRFWFGPKITGRSVMGALMPSVDGVGRYFPLCVVGTFETPIGPPEINEQSTWFDAVETLMLTALSDDGTYEALLEGLEALPAPDHSLVVPPDGADIRGMFQTLRHAQWRELYDPFTCWWATAAGGTNAEPSAFLRRGLPSPVEYAMMLRMNHGTEMATVGTAREGA